MNKSTIRDSTDSLGGSIVSNFLKNLPDIPCMFQVLFGQAGYEKTD